MQRVGSVVGLIHAGCRIEPPATVLFPRAERVDVALLPALVDAAMQRGVARVAGEGREATGLEERAHVLSMLLTEARHEGRWRWWLRRWLPQRLRSQRVCIRAGVLVERSVAS